MCGLKELQIDQIMYFFSGQKPSFRWLGSFISEYFAMKWSFFFFFSGFLLLVHQQVDKVEEIVAQIMHMIIRFTFSKLQ